MRQWFLETTEMDGLMNDRCLTHGLGVFETILAVDGRLVAVERHFARLAAGCERLGISPIDEARVSEALHAVLREDPAGRIRVRVTRTGGAGTIASLAGEGSRTLLSVAPCPDPPESLRVMTAPWPLNEHSPLAGVKGTSYAEHLVALDHAREHGVDEMIFGNTAGRLCEAATANVFCVRGGRIATPSAESGCLPGTAAARVLECAVEEGIGVEPCEATLEEAKKADEVFLTSATRGVFAVSEWDGVNRAVGPVTVQLRRAFERTIALS